MEHTEQSNEVPKHRCPRRGAFITGSPFVYDQEEIGDNYLEDGSCSYCGSLHPDEFMKRLRQGDCELVPTDKGYKVYIRNLGGAAFKQTYRNCNRQCDCPEPKGPKECTAWVTRDMPETKFYFSHLTVEQMDEFIQLCNDKKIKLAYPGYFYVLPFFIQPAGTKASTTE